jgi:hypothetical protein
MTHLVETSTVDDDDDDDDHTGWIFDSGKWMYSEVAI